MEIQIVDTHESLKTRFNIGFYAIMFQFNRTLLIETILSCITKIEQIAQPIIPADRQKLRFCRPLNSNVIRYH